MLNSICEFACGNNTAKYVIANERRKGEKGTYAYSVDVSISERYMKDAYESCKQVSMPQSGQAAMDIACGVPVALCDHKKSVLFLNIYGNPIVNALF